MKKVKIKIKADGDLDYIDIGGRRFQESDGSSEPKPTSNIVDEIIITDTNPTCVWRNGRRYCA